MTDNNSSEGLPKYHKSYWKDSADFKTFPSLNEDIEVDVTIIGGGITGITTAYQLINEGLKVAIIEADKILHGTTGHTTAKITTQHDLIYSELIEHFGSEKAKLYYRANDDALQFIRNVIREHKINCDFSNEDAYIYTNSEAYIKKLDSEYKAYEKLGINSESISSLPFELPIKGAISIKDQAQFHPLKYLYQLTELYLSKGGLIYENTVAVDIDEGVHPKVYTRDGNKIKSNYVVISSHFPFYSIKGLYFTRMYAERSYIIGIKPDHEFPGGMYLSAENPKRSLRYTVDNGKQMILIGGESHKAGQGISEMLHYKALQNFGQDVFNKSKIDFRWSTQDLITLDKVPYIGHITSNTSNILVATGYRKWGMTTGTAAAILMKDIIIERNSPYTELFTPSRFYMDPSLKQFILQNYDVAKHLIKGKFETVFKTPESLENDEGAVVTVNGKRAGAYKDSTGKIHIVDTTCSHLGCELEWNDSERTWDCPCHGSRFSYKGEVVEGPAENPLDVIDL